MAHKVIWREHYVIRQFWGEVSAAEFAATIWDSTSHPQFGQVKFVINDLTEATPALDETFQLSRFKSLRNASVAANPQARFLIVTEDERIISLVKMFTQLSPTPDFATTVYPTLDAALASMPISP